ncbi:hypothetical protein ACTA71_007515 [Dictyostelium dimigraforme]
MKSDKPSFTYFKVLVLGQLPRFTLNYFGIDFEDNYCDSIDDEFRKTLKFGQLPLFVDSDGFRLTQTDAICKYIAAKHDFLGKSIKERAIVDETISAVHDDVIMPGYKVGKGVEDKKVIDTIISRHFTAFEKALTENKFIAGGDNYTLADLYVFVAYHYYKYLGYSEKFQNKFPQLEALQAHFESNKAIAEYIKNRPDSGRGI